MKRGLASITGAAMLLLGGARRMRQRSSWYAGMGVFATSPPRGRLMSVCISISPGMDRPTGISTVDAERAAAFQQSNDELYLCEIASGKAQRFWKLSNP